MTTRQVYRYILILVFLLLPIATVWGQKPISESDIDAFVEAKASKLVMHTSDTLMLNYTLYSTVELSQVAKWNLPMSKEMKQTNIAATVKIKSVIKNGKKYYIYPLRKSILEPISSGDISIPAGNIVVQYNVPTGKVIKNLFGDHTEVVSIYKEVQIEAIKIKVHDMQAI